MVVEIHGGGRVGRVHFEAGLHFTWSFGPVRRDRAHKLEATELVLEADSSRIHMERNGDSHEPR
jgi:hypothetical protein